MKDLISEGYELLTVLLPFSIVLAVLNKREKQNNKPDSLLHFLMVGFFAVYMFAIFTVTSAGTLFGLLRYSIELHSGDQFNFVPFAKGIDIVEYLQNILLFIPLGFLLPFIWPNTGTFKYILLSGLSFSLLIEMSQTLSHRTTDVDDLIMNTAGALLGYVIYRLFEHIAKWEYKRLNYRKYEPLIYIGAMFLGHFLFYNKLGLAQILSGF